MPSAGQSLSAWQHTPVGPSYQMGIGDVVQVHLWGEVTLTLQLEVPEQRSSVADALGAPHVAQILESRCPLRL